MLMVTDGITQMTKYSFKTYARNSGASHRIRQVVKQDKTLLDMVRALHSNTKQATDHRIGIWRKLCERNDKPPVLRYFVAHGQTGRARKSRMSCGTLATSGGGVHGACGPV